MRRTTWEVKWNSQNVSEGHEQDFKNLGSEFMGPKINALLVCKWDGEFKI